MFLAFFQQFTTVQLMSLSVPMDISASTLIISVTEFLTVTIAPMNLDVVSITNSILTIATHSRKQALIFYFALIVFPHIRKYD